MKSNLLLLFFSCLICGLSAFGLNKVFGFSELFYKLTSGSSNFAEGQPEGSSFSSLKELREELTKRDKRDVKNDSSVSLRTIVKPNSSDFIIYHLAPNLNLKFMGEPLKTNSFGLRGEEINVEKEPGVYRVALLGDSFAFGWGVKENESFAKILEAELSQKFKEANISINNQPFKKVEVINFGTPGYATFQEVERFQEIGLQFKPDLVLVYFIQNDFGPPFFIKNFDGEELDLKNAQDFNTYRHSENTEVSSKARTWLKKINPNYSLGKLSKLSKEHDFKVSIAIHPNPKWQKDLDRLWVLKEDSNLNLIRMREELLSYLDRHPEIDKKKDLSLKTDPHPSALMHEILGGILARGVFEVESSG